MSPGLSLHQNLNYIQKLLNSYLVWLGVNTLNNDIWLVPLLLSPDERSFKDISREKKKQRKQDCQNPPQGRGMSWKQGELVGRAL